MQRAASRKTRFVLLEVSSGKIKGAIVFMLEKIQILICPHCRQEVYIRKIPHPGIFKDYRICPNCDGGFTPDRNTKYLQAICIVIALVSTVMTVLLYLGDTDWLTPAIVSYIILGLIIYWGNIRIYLVPYKYKEQK